MAAIHGSMCYCFENVREKIKVWFLEDPVVFIVLRASCKFRFNVMNTGTSPSSLQCPFPLGSHGSKNEGGSYRREFVPS